MQTSVSGVNFIRTNEGIFLEVENDVGHPVIGHGHDITPDELASGLIYGTRFGDGITIEQADAILGKDVAKVDTAMNRQGLTGIVNQNQWDCLADFCFNLGEGALIRMLSHGLEQVPMQIPRWTHGEGGVELPGLVTRRQAEVEWWNTPV